MLAEEAARRRITLSAIVREIAETAAESIRERAAQLRHEDRTPPEEVTPR